MFSPKLLISQKVWPPKYLDLLKIFTSQKFWSQKIFNVQNFLTFQSFDTHLNLFNPKSFYHLIVLTNPPNIWPPPQIFTLNNCGISKIVKSKFFWLPKILTQPKQIVTSQKFWTPKPKNLDHHPSIFTTQISWTYKSFDPSKTLTPQKCWRRKHKDNQKCWLPNQLEPPKFFTSKFLPPKICIPKKFWTPKNWTRTKIEP